MSWPCSCRTQAEARAGPGHTSLPHGTETQEGTCCPVSCVRRGRRASGSVSVSHRYLPFWLQNLQASQEELKAESQEGPWRLWSQLECTRTDEQELGGKGPVLGVRPSEARMRASLVGADQTVAVAVDTLTRELPGRGRCSLRWSLGLMLSSPPVCPRDLRPLKWEVSKLPTGAGFPLPGSGG